MTLTGGSASDTHADYEYKARVIRYKMSGDFEDLPSMNTGRSSHACGLFTNIEGEIVSTVSPAGLEVKGPSGVGGRKNLGAHPILQSAVCWYGRIGCIPEFFRPPIPLGP